MCFVLFKMFLVCAIINAEIIGSNNSTKQSLSKKENATEAVKIIFSNESVVSETQHTICSIKTEDVVAKAQSTASRILTGVCSSEEMTKAFKNMEKTFIERLDQVQQILIAFIQSKYQPVVQKNIIKSSKLSPFKTVDYFFNKNQFKNHS